MYYYSYCILLAPFMHLYISCQFNLFTYYYMQEFYISNSLMVTGIFLSMANLVHGAINHNKIQANKQTKIIQTFSHKNYNKDIWDASHNLATFVQFKKSNKHPWRSVEACNVIKSKTPPWMFFMFSKVFKWYQIAQHIIIVPQQGDFFPPFCKA